MKRRASGQRSKGLKAAVVILFLVRSGSGEAKFFVSGMSRCGRGTTSEALGEFYGAYRGCAWLAYISMSDCDLEERKHQRAVRVFLEET